MLSVHQAVTAIRKGAVVAYPTEAVYGLGCDPANEAAVRTVLQIKDRHEDAGLILIGARIEHLEPWMDLADDVSLRPALDTWPGPVTWLVPSSPATPRWISGKHDTVALRMTAHPVCRLLCDLFGGALVSTSANPSGMPPARDVATVRAYFGPLIGDRVAGIVAGALGDSTSPSVIRDLATGKQLRS
jgi:L-threonylcarbamoyladenylate synthase